MNYEIERKFLLSSVPEGLIDGTEIIQGYLLAKDSEIRIRKSAEKYFITEKSAGSLVRTENETEITKQVFDILWPMTDGKRVEKIRFYLKSKDGLTWEIDQYAGKLKNLVIAEIEIPDENYTIDMPDIIKQVLAKEVTENSKYKNKNLATDGLS